MSKHTRRDFIRLTGLTVAGVAIAACAPRAPEVVEKIVEVPVEVPKEVIKEVVVEPTPLVSWHWRVLGYGSHGWRQAGPLLVQ